MQRRPGVLDLFCGAGGAGFGYWLAGCEVVGVDINPQPKYPFPFIQMDALEALARLLAGEGLLASDGHTYYLNDFVAIHASPPCQHFTAYRRNGKVKTENYENLIEPTREMLRSTGLPYVIENVQGAPLQNPVKLCGSMFDGRVLGPSYTNDIQRHRLFETNWPLEAPGKCDHSIWPPDRYPGGRSVARGGHSKALVRKTIEIGSWDIPLEKQKWAMGIGWPITVRELSEAIPPAYTEYIGSKLIEHLEVDG